MIGFKTIQSRIFIMITTVISVSAISVFSYLLLDFKSRSYQSFESVTQTINNTLVSNISSYVYTQDHEGMKQVIDSIKSNYIEDILILDARGNIIASQNYYIGSQVKYSNFDALLLEDTHTIKEENKYIISNTFELLDVPLGYVVVEGNMNYYSHELSNGIQRLLAVIAPLILLGLLVMFYLSRSINKPLHRIIKKVQDTEENKPLYFEEEHEEEFIYLTQTIAKKHNALLKLNTTLEDEVAYKTQALQKLNETLEFKVEKAVKEVQTKEQMMQQQARLAQMGEMLSMIAHQWRQPLSAMSSAMMVVDRNIEIQKYDLNTETGQKDFLLFLEHKQIEINENIQYLSTTIDDFRNFFNPYSEKVNCLIQEPVQKALKLIQSSMKNKDITITLDLQDKKYCPLYPNEVMQVILNILKNASDALVEKDMGNKKVHIRSYDIEKGVILEISNNGVKIPEAYVENIFDPYFTTKDTKIGTGLGLYMAKNIIEEHHKGKIVLKQRQGKTCFVLTFYI